jgi:hypothetical protein
VEAAKTAAIQEQLDLEAEIERLLVEEQEAEQVERKRRDEVERRVQKEVAENHRKVTNWRGMK